VLDPMMHSSQGSPASGEDAVPGDGDLGPLREVALRMLAAEPSTRAVLALKLARRGFPRAHIAALLDRLVAVGLVDDRAYAEGFVRRRLRIRPRGFALLRRELLRKGVPAAVVDEVLAAAASATDEVTLARTALARRAYRLDRLSPDVARQRAIGILRRLGFSAAAIAGALPWRRGGGEE
jgi:regulatory protein